MKRLSFIKRHLTLIINAQKTLLASVYYLVPAGLEIEIVQYLSGMPSERNNDLLNVR